MALQLLDDRSDGEVLLGSTQAVPHAATELRVVGAASGIGAADSGCGLGPDALRKYGLTGQLRDHGLKAIWADIVRRPALRAATENIKEIKAYCEELAAAVGHALHQRPACRGYRGGSFLRDSKLECDRIRVAQVYGPRLDRCPYG